MTTRPRSTMNALDIDESCVMVLENCGPKAIREMRKSGNIGLPRSVLKKGDHRHGPHFGRRGCRHRLRYG